MAFTKIGDSFSPVVADATYAVWQTHLGAYTDDGKVWLVSRTGKSASFVDALISSILTSHETYCIVGVMYVMCVACSYNLKNERIFQDKTWKLTITPTV